ncbi:MAG: alpha/beta hydrolase [Chloroflexota bacterium]
MTKAHTDKKQVLFIQGGGDNGYEADEKLVTSLKKELGTAYSVHYPEMIPDNDAPDFGWGKQIAHALAGIKGDVILVAHSIGASILLKYLTENKIDHPIGGIFLISTPFVGYENWQFEGLALRDDFTEALPKEVPVFLYHSKDDEEVSLKHVHKYAKKLPDATVREITKGGHQLGNDLSPVARDIQNLR